MPPKVRITADMITRAAFAIAREEGAENINARTISLRLGCSTQPVLYQFATVDDVRKAAYAYADAYHSRCLMEGLEQSEMPLLTLGLNYIRFAAEEKNLFRFLFQSAGITGGGNLLTLLDSPEMQPLTGIVQQSAGLDEDAAKNVFMQLFLVIHGYASLLSNNPIPYSEKDATKMLEKAFYGACAAEENYKEESL